MRNLSERDKKAFGLTHEIISQIKDVARQSGAAIDPEQHRINRDAILFLRRCYSRHVIVRDAASVLTWLAAVDKDFVDRLRRRQPFPLFVLMHWAVLLGELDGKMWWARNSGKALITELSDALQHDILQWGVTQLWPKEKMGL